MRAPADLDPEKAYTFTVVWSRLQAPAVERIERDGKLIYDRSLCEVHHLQMQLQKVPFIFGEQRTEDPEQAHGGEPSIRTVNQLFPNYRDVAYAGCVMEPNVRATVYVCRRCREAYFAWKKQQDGR